MIDSSVVTAFPTLLAVTRSGRDFYCPYLRIQCRILPGMNVCTVTGDIDMATEALLQRALTEFEQGATPRVLLDLTEVAFLSVRGARLLHYAVKRAHAQTRRLTIVVSHPVARALAVTGYGGSMRTYRTMPDARDGGEAPTFSPTMGPQEVTVQC